MIRGSSSADCTPCSSPWVGKSAGRREMRIRRLRRGIYSRVRVLLQLLERRTGLVGGKNAVWVEKCSDWFLTEGLGCAHPFSRRFPVAEIVYLQLNHVLVGIRIV